MLKDLENFYNNGSPSDLILIYGNSGRLEFSKKPAPALVEPEEEGITKRLFRGVTNFFRRKTTDSIESEGDCGRRAKRLETAP